MAIIDYHQIGERLYCNKLVVLVAEIKLLGIIQLEPIWYIVSHLRQELA